MGMFPILEGCELASNFSAMMGDFPLKNSETSINGISIYHAW